MANKTVLKRLKERYHLPADNPLHVDEGYLENLVSAGAITQEEAVEILNS